MPDNTPNSSSDAKICPSCGSRSRSPARIDYRGSVKLDRRDYEIVVRSMPIEACAECHDQFFGEEAMLAIDEATRAAAGLLSASGIRGAMHSLDEMTQVELSEMAGVAPETISRWLAGHVVQSRLADRMLRVIFAVPEARVFLSDLKQEAVRTIPTVRTGSHCGLLPINNVKYKEVTPSYTGPQPGGSGHRLAA